MYGGTLPESNGFMGTGYGTVQWVRRCGAMNSWGQGVVRYSGYASVVQ